MNAAEPLRSGLLFVALIGLCHPTALAQQARTRSSLPQAQSSTTTRSASPIAVIDKTLVLRANLQGQGVMHRYRLNLPQDAIVSVTVRAVENPLYPIVSLKSIQGAMLKRPVAYNKRSAQLGFYKLPSGHGVLEVFAQGGRTGEYLLDVQVVDRQQFNAQVVRLTNAARIKAGLQPLVRNSLLDRASDAHVRDMDQQNAYLAHTGSQGSTPEERIKSFGYKAAWVNLEGNKRRTIRLENAATGWATPAEVVEAWLASPGHRAAMLDPETKEIGVAFVYDNENATTYWVQNFGYPWSPGLTPWF
jgi:uncharacterized protein YkwD